MFVSSQGVGRKERSLHLLMCCSSASAAAYSSSREGRIQSAERALPTFTRQLNLRIFFQPDSADARRKFERSFVCFPIHKTHFRFLCDLTSNATKNSLRI